MTTKGIIYLMCSSKTKVKEIFTSFRGVFWGMSFFLFLLLISFYSDTGVAIGITSKVVIVEVENRLILLKEMDTQRSQHNRK